MIIIVSISIAAVRVKLMLTQEQAIDTVQVRRGTGLEESQLYHTNYSLICPLYEGKCRYRPGEKNTHFDWCWHCLWCV